MHPDTLAFTPMEGGPQVRIHLDDILGVEVDFDATDGDGTRLVTPWGEAFVQESAGATRLRLERTRLVRLDRGAA